MSSARRAALEVFFAWDSSRRSADDLLDEWLGELSGRDRDLAAELVRGVFRWRGRLDWQLASLVRRPLESLHPSVLWILRLGLYQLEHLDRVPRHAACDTSVELAKRCAPRGAEALVNAVLRKAPDALADLVEPDASEDPAGHLAARTSHPRWLLERWLSRFGFRRTLALAARNTERPPLTLRVASDRVDPVDLLADLRALGIDAEPGTFLPDFVRLPGGWHPAVREFLESGLAVVQDEAAGLVAHTARAWPGASLLDVCAAPGGKAVHFAQLAGDPVTVAADISPRRLTRIRETAGRVGLRHLYAVASDGLRPALAGTFSRVLVDAPCTNTGVLAKRPDARWRRGPEDVVRLAGLQGELLDASRAFVGPGGLLVYSTCSIEPEENEDVIRDYLARHPADTVVPADEVLPEELVHEGFLRTDPCSMPLDGAFAAVIRPGGAALRALS
ncbi:MAG: 16S rRNA (cytosine(967)-C(5))-methyltransferase RsmB [Candidatus Eiseniibacteriota bacterium]